MLELRGDFAVPGDPYRNAFVNFQTLGLLAGIIADNNTMLTVATRQNSRYGDTYLIVGGVDVHATVWTAWCTPGVHTRPVNIRIEIVSGLQTPAELLEVLTHEWCLHGDKNWRFVRAMRMTSDVNEIQQLTIKIIGTADTVKDVKEHREIAEDTHDFFRMTMQELARRHPNLRDQLLAAWRADIDTNKASARPGLLAANVDWHRPPPAAPAPVVQQPDLGLFSDEEKAAVDDWFSQ